MTTGALPFQNPFVGRESELRTYRQFLASATPWVMCITAQGGVGKTTLLRHFAEQTPDSALAITLNFAIDSLRVDPLQVLEHMAGRVEEYCSPRRMQLFRDTLDAGQASLLQLSTQMTQHITVGDNSKFEGQGMQLNISAAVQEKRREVRNQVTSVFSQLLLSLERTHLVLLLDTCEWLNEPEGLEVGKWFLNEVLPHLHERLQPRRKLSVVIASRMKPTMPAIERQDQYTMPLPMLDKVAVDTYFEQIGMHDSVLRQRIFDITHGHALCVSIIGSLWQEQGEHPFTLAEFPKLQDQFNERALLEFIQERLNQRLVSPYRELTHYGVLLQTFNLPMLQAVFPELFPDSEASDHFQQLLRYPYIEPRGNQQYAFHSLLREIQAVYIREQEPDTWQEYHKRALAYLDQKSPRPPEWYYHAIAYAEEQGMSEWWDVVQEAQLIGTREQLTALLQAAHDETLSLSPASCATRAHLPNRRQKALGF